MTRRLVSLLGVGVSRRCGTRPVARWGPRSPRGEGVRRRRASGRRSARLTWPPPPLPPSHHSPFGPITQRRRRLAARPGRRSTPATAGCVCLGSHGCVARVGGLQDRPATCPEACRPTKAATARAPNRTRCAAPSQPGGAQVGRQGGCPVAGPQQGAAGGAGGRASSTPPNRDPPWRGGRIGAADGVGAGEGVPFSLQRATPARCGHRGAPWRRRRRPAPPAGPAAPRWRLAAPPQRRRGGQPLPAGARWQ